MISARLVLPVLLVLPPAFGAAPAPAADALAHRNTYAQAYGATKGSTEVDPAKDLPRYPAVAPADAVGTWQVKPGFRIELVASEPQVRDPVAVTFDENGRMFVCEMIDYSEERDRNPHLGRISVLEDRDGDGRYETSRVFADNLPWPNGLIWAHGGLYVGATPDIWRFEDRDGDGRAEVREKVFTGFGTGLARLNVQAMFNSFAWGADNRIHVQGGTGNRGLIRSLRRPELPAEELGGRNFWFDPRTHAFGFTPGGAQYGMSFDDYGRRFACSNSDHLQFWVYDGRYAERNPHFTPPVPRQSIAADGGAAEVHRISPDEPWRIIRTRWRIGGVVRGAVEGGGRVSGYFTGASGTLVYRGDAYGADFVNNTFSGDSGGQLVHRKRLFEDGASLVGRRPADEQGFEFAASRDTWVRVVNFANAPDGTLHLCDMYREVIEHPWSIPDEIKRHLDLNSGNDRGRIYRLVPVDAAWRRRANPTLGTADTATLVATLTHPNGWHRDTASRLLYERQDRAAVPLLARLVREAEPATARFHALGALQGLGALDAETLAVAADDRDAHVRERAIVLAEPLLEAGQASPALLAALDRRAGDVSARVRMQLAFSAAYSPALAPALARIAARDHADQWISVALLTSPPPVIAATLLPAMTRDPALARKAAPFVARLIETRAATAAAADLAPLIDFIAQPGTSPLWIRALGEGLRRAGSGIAQADRERKLDAVFARASARARDAGAPAAERLEAVELLAVGGAAQARPALAAARAAGQPEAVQAAAVRALALQTGPEVAAVLLDHWDYAPKAREAALAALLAREDRTRALLDAVAAGKVPATDFSASQIEALARHKHEPTRARARTVLAAVIPPSREEVAAKFQPAVALSGDASRGRGIYAGRCSVCHRAGGEGMELGPDLVTVKSRGRDSLLAAIINPHQEVAPQYIAYEVNTKDGNAYLGMISRDEASSLSLRIMGGAEVTLPRANIRGSSSSGKSLMPEGLEGGLSVQEMADLLTFIEELK